MALTWEDVVATRSPGVEETTSYGTRSLKVGRKLLARLRTDPDAVVLKVTECGVKPPAAAFRPAAGTPS